MPFTMICCVIGAMSISAFPLFSGFVAKSLTMTALGDTGIMWAYFVLLFASAGVLEHSGIKIPYFAFFAHDRGFKTTEAPLNMRVAMGIAAFLCVAIGVFPAPLYNILPHAVDYHPYDASHVTSQMQLLIFAMLAFVVLIRMRLYPPEIPSVVLNSDWFYRRLAPQIGRPVLRGLLMVWGGLLCQLRGFIEAFWFIIDKLVRSPAAGPTIPGPAALVQLILLLAVLSMGYVAAIG